MNRVRGILFMAGGLAIGLLIGGIVLFSIPQVSSAARRPNPPSTGVKLEDFTLEGLN